MYPGEDSEYFSWLCNKITDRKGMRTHSLLLYKLYSTEFKVIVTMDENRIDDVSELREVYGEETGYVYSDVPEYECSILELIITLSNRIINIMGDYDAGLANWFWIILGNLLEDVDYFSNKFMSRSSTIYELDTILDNFVNRKYKFDGSGGLFPLNSPHKDQRKEEIWYQMQSYLNEFYPD